jgi:hypothetical protein
MKAKINKLIGLCAAGFSVDVNDHLINYESFDDHFEFIEQNGTPICDDIKAGIKQNNRLVELTIFPLSPAGSVFFIHHDFEAAIDMALDYFE